MLFCPFLSTINFFKCVALFYIKLLGVMLFNKQPKAMFKVSTTCVLKAISSFILDFYNKQFLPGHATPDAILEFVSSWLCCS